MKSFTAISVLLALAVTLHAAEPTVIRHADRVLGTLPAGDSELGLVLDGLEGTLLSIKAKAVASGLEPSIRLFDPSDVELRLNGRYRRGTGSRTARLKRFVLPTTGRYTVVVQSLSTSGGEVKVKVKADHPVKLRDGGTIAFQGAESAARFPAFAGTLMRFVVKGRYGFAPHVDRMLAPGPTEIAVSAVVDDAGVLRSWGDVCEEMGDYHLMVEGEGDARGDWRSKIKLRHPESDPRTLTVEGQPAETFTGDKLPPDDGPDQPGPGGGGGSPVVQTSTFRVVLDMLDPPPDPVPLSASGGSGGRSRFDTQVFIISLENISGTPQSVQFVAFPWHNIVVRNAITKNVVWIAYTGTLPVAPTVTFAPAQRETWFVSWDIPSVGAPPAGDYEAVAVFHTSDARIPVGATLPFRLD